MRDVRVGVGPEKTVTKRGTNISTAVEVVAAVSGKRIIITDFFVSCGTAAYYSFLDGGTVMWDTYLGGSLAYCAFSGALNTPIALTAGNALKVKASTTNTDYSILINYYVEQ